MAKKTSRVKAKALTSEEQSRRFIEAAKRAEADERPEEFEKALKRIARAQFPKHGKH